MNRIYMQDSAKFVYILVAVVLMAWLVVYLAHTHRHSASAKTDSTARVATCRKSTETFESNMAGNETFDTPYYYRGDGTWASTAMVGATAESDGVDGHVPAPSKGSQNSYLRGDGTWQFANNAPTAAQYYLATQPVPRWGYVGQPFPFSTKPSALAGSAIAQLTTTQFTLAAGYAYKLTATIAFVPVLPDDAVTYQWYNATTGELVGVVGVSSADTHMPATGYITAATPVVVMVMITAINSTDSTVRSAHTVMGSTPRARIETVANNNTVVPFAGATTSSPGQQGYIPAPPAGAQNLFLRGDGTWAGGYPNAPSAAQYYMASQSSAVELTPGTPFGFSMVPAYVAGSAISQHAPGEFSLLPNYTYKLSAELLVDRTAVYQWFNATTGDTIGNAAASGNIAMGFLTLTRPAVVCVTINKGVGGLASADGQCSWALIEVVSNNNVVVQFSGASADTPGLAGYVPPVPAGMQDGYLRGDGTWQTESASHLVATMPPGTPGKVSPGMYVSFPKVTGTSGAAIQQTSATVFALAEGHTYKCTASCGNIETGLEILYSWYNMSAAAAFGSTGQSTYRGVLSTVPAVGYITTKADTKIAVVIIGTEGGTIGCSDRYINVPSVTIEKI